MSDSGQTVVAGRLQDRLPAGWTVETFCEDDGTGDSTGGERVCGYADSGESGPREQADGRGAAFEIRRDGELWTATWLDRRGPGADRSVFYRVTGVRERCVEWVVERIGGAEEVDGE